MEALACHGASILAAGAAAGVAGQALASGWCDRESGALCGTDPGQVRPDLPLTGGDHRPIPPGESTPPGSKDEGGSGEPHLTSPIKNEQSDATDLIENATRPDVLQGSLNPHLRATAWLKPSTGAGPRSGSHASSISNRHKAQSGTGFGHGSGCSSRTLARHERREQERRRCGDL